MGKTALPPAVMGFYGRDNTERHNGARQQQKRGTA
jgi:hypothetical protein